MREFSCFVRLRTTTKCPLILPRRLGGKTTAVRVMKRDEASCDCFMRLDGFGVVAMV